MRNIRIADVRDREPGPRPGRRDPASRLATFVATLPIILLVPALVLVSMPAFATAGPEIVANPSSVSVGGKVTIVGAGFPRGETGHIVEDSTARELGRYKANSRGTFRASFVLDSIEAGTHRVSAVTVDAAGAVAERATAELTVLDNPVATATREPTPEPTPAATVAPPDPTATPAPRVAPPEPSPTPVVTTSPTSSAPPAPTAAPSPVTGPAATSSNSVRAYYYLWWSTRHWHDKLGLVYPYSADPLPLPATLDANDCQPTSNYLGNTLTDVPRSLYSQDDPGVIEGHVRAAKRSGLSGFVLNWGGTGLASQTLGSTTYTGRLAEAFAASARVGGFSNWVSYKSAALPSVSYIKGDLDFLYAEFGSDPTWERRGGRPVLVLNGSRKYSDADVASISAAARGRFYLIGDESAATLTDDRLSLYDGVTYYWSTQRPSATSFATIQSMAERVHAAGKTWFAPFTPGYDSVLLGGSTCVPRGDGETLTRLHAGNSPSSDGMILISWNEIAEGSYVEPLQRWGTRYLDVLSDVIRGR